MQRLNPIAALLPFDLHHTSTLADGLTRVDAVLILPQKRASASKQTTMIT